jgi:hypothetical protein
MRFRLASILILIVAFGCGGNNPQDPKLFKLASGKQITVTGVGRIDFPNSDSALVMNYETEIPIEDKVALRKEVDEIWNVFQKDVEAAQLKAGVIRATHVEGTGFVKSGKGYGFVFAKRDDGRWHALEDDQK